MTIDEAIKDFKDDAENNRVDLDLEFAKKNDQIADWLEELKEYKENQHRSLRHMYEKGYNKAIDDFAILMKETLNLAEQLKVMGENDKSI